MTKRSRLADLLYEVIQWGKTAAYSAIVLLLVLSSFAARAQPALQSGTATERDFGTIVRLSKWPTTALNVCWENPSSADEELRSVVRRAVEETWVRNSALTFDGWGHCEQASLGIRIQVDEAYPHVKKIGRFGDGLPNGMVLNFSFNKWKPTCRLRLEFCVYAIAVHEFGHALGFTHEQNRPDAPEECQADSQGVDGDFLVTNYDPASIMNYCNPAWIGDGHLSVLDIIAVRTIYGDRQK